MRSGSAPRRRPTVAVFPGLCPIIILTKPLMKKVLFAAVLLGLASSVFAQNAPPSAGFDISNFGVRIEPDKRVMIVLATLEAARTTNDAGDSVAAGESVEVPERLPRVASAQV